MAKQHLTQEELERDEVAESIHDTIVFVEKHWKLAAALAILVLVGILVSVTMKTKTKETAEAVNRGVVEGLMQIEQIDMNTEKQQRDQSAETVVMSMDDLLLKYGNYSLSVEAYYIKGLAYYKVDNFEQARVAYQAYIDNATNDVMQARGEIAMAYTIENESYLIDDQDTSMDRLESALTHYERAVSLAKGTAYEYYALMGQARIKELTNNLTDAITLYQRVVDERPTPAMWTEKEKPETFEKDFRMSALYDMFNQAQEMISFRETAKLRLASLKARTGQDDEAAAETATP